VGSLINRVERYKVLVTGRTEATMLQTVVTLRRLDTGYCCHRQV